MDQNISEPFESHLGLSVLTFPELDTLFLDAERVGQESAWWQHVPFAHWLISACEPRLLVELGTHVGVSYSAFCNAIQNAKLPTRCWAVDTWRGDEHAGYYDNRVFEEFCEFHNRRYASFSGLLRCSFDEAVVRFEDASIDLLHIDGLHTYEAVRRDFETWLPKLSSRAIVLFHDTNVLKDDFGVRRLWQELRAKYPAFEFLHGYGLGVLGVGTEIPSRIAGLLQMADAGDIARLRSRFAWLGERWLAETREKLLISQHQKQIGGIKLDLTAANIERERAEAEKEQVQEQIRQLQQELKEASVERERVEIEAAEAHAAAAAEIRARSKLEETLEEAHHAVAEAQSERDASSRDRKSLQSELAAARSEILASSRDAMEARSHLASVQMAYDRILNSTAWRISYPLRHFGERLSPKARRAIRGGAKIAWWTVCLKLRRKLRQRRDALRALSHDFDASQKARHDTPELQRKTVVDPHLESRSMRIVFVSGEDHTPGHIYRVERAAAAARAAGAQVKVVTIQQLSACLRDIADSDVLFIWRSPMDERMSAAIAAARSAGLKIVFDVDDLMVEPNLAFGDAIDAIRHQGLSAEAVAEFYERIRQVMLASDFCTSTTHELSHHMRRANKSVRTLANTFDHAMFVSSRVAARRWARKKDGLLRIGYAGGSRTHQKDFGVCTAAVAETLRKFPNARLVLFKSTDNLCPMIDLSEFPELRGLEDRVEWRSFVPLEKLPEELARFDINLAPLEVGNAFCEAKSELKYFEAALVDVPTIASPTGPFSRAIRDGETGFLADSRERWTAVLMELSGDATLRRRIAECAKRDVLWRYGPERHVEEFAYLINILKGGREAAAAFQRATSQEGNANVTYADGIDVPKHKIIMEHDALGVSNVTVVVPLYNYAGFVVEALDSIYAQTLTSLDLIIVDDCSTDDSLAVVLSWAKRHCLRFNRLLVVRNMENSGLGPTRNVGFELADSPWVLPLDADNHLRPKCTAECLRVAADHMVAYAYPIIQRFGDFNDLMGTLPYDPLRFIGGNYVDAMALISRAAWAKVGGYRHVAGGWEDFDLWCSFIEHGLRGEQVSGEPLAEYRVHQTSMSQSSAISNERMQSVIQNLTERHPWLAVTWQYQRPVDDHEDKQRTPLVQRSGSEWQLRLEDILPVLRCPESGTSLRIDVEGQALISERGRRWPIVNGRPNFFDGLEPKTHLDSHASNPLPDEARQLTRSCSGRVLHLSAGASAEQFPNVIELEAAVFRNTDVIGDAHHLPFADGSFEAVVSMNAFEHYADPVRAAGEIWRVLSPGGRVLVRTAFLQPEHEAPWHFYNCTRFGLQKWFEQFDMEYLKVSDNFHPGHPIAWLASECENALRIHSSDQAADMFAATPLKQFISLWRTPEQMRTAQGDPSWLNLMNLPQQAKMGIAAGFEYMGRKPREPSSSPSAR